MVSLYALPALSHDTDHCVGHFYWDGENFSGSAEDVEFTIEGDGSVPVLRATLIDQEGNGQRRDVNLSERISNNDGNFNYSKYIYFRTFLQPSTLIPYTD